MRLALGLCLAASNVTADPLGFLDYNIVGAPYVDDLVDMGDGVSVAETEDGLAFVRVDTGELFICDPRNGITLGSAVLALVEGEVLIGRGCAEDIDIGMISSQRHLQGRVIEAYASRLEPSVDREKVFERFHRSALSLINASDECPQSSVSLFEFLSSADFAAAVDRAATATGLPVSACPGWVRLP